LHWVEANIDVKQLDLANTIRWSELEIYIRELSILDAGIGCALWDAAIILSRWIYERGEQVFKNANVLELGAGVGLPGILCSYFAKSTILSDYLPQILENLEYNLKLNSNVFSANDSDDNQQVKPIDTARVAFFDWNAVLKGELKPGMKPSAEMISNAKSSVASSDQKDQSSDSDSGMLSSEEEYEEEDDEQGFFGAFKMSSDDDDAIGSLVSSSSKPSSSSSSKLSSSSSSTISKPSCSKSSSSKPSSSKLFSSKPSSSKSSTSQKMLSVESRQIKNQTSSCSKNSWIAEKYLFPIEKVDILIGSELTYSLANVENVIAVIELYMKEDGVFYEILSNDRDGVSVFVSKVEEAGYIVEIYDVPDKYLGNYGTNQRYETYRFYTVRRKSHVQQSKEKYPTMKG